MSMKETEETNFSSLLFDTLFGLILFFGLDSFLDIGDPMHFVIYVFSTVILIHWWLTFKSADDTFSTEVSDSAADLVFGIVDVILIEYIVLYARGNDLGMMNGFLIALLLVDLVWALTWRYAGRWRTKDRKRIKSMERQCDKNIILNIAALVPFVSLAVCRDYISTNWFIVLFIAFYSAYIFFSFRKGILNLRIF